MLVKTDYINLPGTAAFGEAFPTIARITISSPPANAFNATLLRALLEAFQAVDKEFPRVQGVIITSNLNNFFSGGIDLTVFTGSEKEWKSYWSNVRAIFRAIYASPMETVAAINGHALGLGCIIALACQQRLMLSGKYTIGLNEAAVGLPLPKWLGPVFANTTSPRHAERYLPIGAALTVKEAHSIGLVDAVFDDVGALNQAAEEYLASRFTRAPYFARTLTIGPLRAGILKQFDDGAQDDIDSSWEGISTDPVKSTLAAVMKRTLNKKSKM